MQPYYAHNSYPTNVIEIADSSYTPQSLPSASMLSMHQAEPFSPDSVYRKRKIERACDACRRRKTKCDGPRMPDNICTNCIQNRKTCSYVEASKPRGPPKAYITSLEDRMEKMEALLKRLRPESDFIEELGLPVIRDSWKSDPELCHVSPREKSTSPFASSSRAKRSPSDSLHSHSLPGVSSTVNDSPGGGLRNRHSAGTPRSDVDLSSDGYTSSDSEEVGELSLSRGMKRLTIRGLEPAQDNRPLADNQVRFHGKSSCFKLIEPTRKLRDEHVYRVTGGDERSRSDRDSTSPINAAASRRPEFWTTPPWELALEGFQDRLKDQYLSVAEDFPPPDLADTLINLYFEHVNPEYPLFHRPTFERLWKEGLQHKDTWFGCLCLALFAVASRWSDDIRVLDDGKYDIPEAERPIDEHKWQRAGWRYFNSAVDLHRGSHSLFNPAGLFEVQTMALLGIFLLGTSFYPVAWLFISVGLRKAQDVGAHRKKIYGDKASIEGELWKRAFWVLVVHDRLASAGLGRPCCSGEEDFDADLPLEVDDEYWETEDPEKAFQQPPGKPSTISAFNSYLKLTKIVAYAMRTIYALDRSKLLISAARPRWQEVLAQLNNAMTEWVDSVPKHLQWSPHMEDPLFSNQSATLYITYYLIQIAIYRPFLPTSLLSMWNIVPHVNMPIPCIAVCVNAGKCVSRIIKAQINRGYSNIPNLIAASHVCSAILLMNFWDLKWQERNQMKADAFEDVKSPLALSMAELLDEVSVFIEALGAVKARWRSAETNLKDINASLPHSLGGFEPSVTKDDPLSREYPSEYEDRTYRNTAPTDYVSLADFQNPPPEYRFIPPPITTYPYNTRTEPSEPSPHFFEFSHITRYPVPSTLPLSSCFPCESDQPQPTTQCAPFQSQHQLSMHSDLGDRGPSMYSLSSLRSRHLFEDATIDDPSASHDGTSLPSQYVIAGRTASSASMPMHQHLHNGDGYGTSHQPRPGWASDLDYNPVYASGLSTNVATVQSGFLPRNKDTTDCSPGQVSSFPGLY